MSENNPFTPGNSISITTSSSPGTQILAAADQNQSVQLRMCVTGTNPVAYGTGPTAAAAAAAAISSSWATNSTPLYPNLVEIFTKPIGDNYIGFVSPAGASTLQVTAGLGN